MSIILAAYITALSIFPCSEVIELSIFDADQPDLMMLASHNPDNHDSGTQDHCSTFCVCDCCGATIWTTHIPLTPPDKLAAPQSIPAIFKTLVSNPAPEDIWQPPKFS